MLGTTQILLIILGVVFLLFFIYYARTFFTPLGGRWYDQKDATSPLITIDLTQFGPFVWGFAEVKGGSFQYNGWFNGKNLKLRRKDSGKEYFMGLNFPYVVYRQLDGTEMAKMEFTFDSNKQELVGKHYSQKIEYRHQPPHDILQRGYIPPHPRVWKRHPKAFQHANKPQVG